MKKELEEAAENYGWRIKTNTFSDRVKANELAESAKQDFIAGAQYQAERMYSEEDLNKMFDTLQRNSVDNVATITNVDLFINSWKREFKKK
jgi:hypothetical protein